MVTNNGVTNNGVTNNGVTKTGVTNRGLLTRFGAATAALTVAVALSGCGSSGNASGSTTSTSTSSDASSSDAGAGGSSGGNSAAPDGGGGSPDILIGMNAGLVPDFTKYAAAFMKAYPKYKVTVKPVPDQQADYIQQLVTQGLSKTLPDIVFNYDGLNQTLNNNKLLFDLKPWLNEGKYGLKGSQFLPNFLAQYEVGDATTGIPVSADASVLYWNKTLFDKYGITDYPNNSWTYEHMYDVANQITQKAKGQVFGMAAPIGDGSGIFTYYPLLKAFGSNLYDPDTKKFVFANEGGIKAWTLALKPYTDKIAPPFTTKVQQKLFDSGQVAMNVAARPSVSQYRDSMKAYDWDVAQMPTANGKSSTGGGSYSMSISANSGNKEGAWQFLSWFFSNDGGLKEAEPNGVIPATKEGLTNGSWLQDTSKVPASLIPVTKYEVQAAILPNPVPDAVQPDMVPAIQKAIQQVLLQGVPIDKAFTDAQDSLNAKLK